MNVKNILDPKKPLSEEQREEIERAAKKEIIYDEDLPEYSAEELERMIERTKELGFSIQTKNK